MHLTLAGQLDPRLKNLVLRLVPVSAYSLEERQEPGAGRQSLSRFYGKLASEAPSGIEAHTCVLIYIPLLFFALSHLVFVICY